MTMMMPEIKNDSTPEQTVKENRKGWKDAGFRIVGHWDSGSPYGDDYTKNFHYRDHHYMLKKSGRTIYCVEPYELESDDITELARLIENGWSVRIGQFPIWYPGRTTQVMIMRKRGNSN